MARVFGHPRDRFGRVEHGQAGKKQFAKYDPLAESRLYAKIQTPGESVQKPGHLPSAARLDLGETVAHDDPVDRRPPGGLADSVLRPYHFAVIARREHLASDPIDPHQGVQVQKAVVERGEQDIGMGVPQPRQIGEVSRGVHDHELAVGHVGKGRS